MEENKAPIYAQIALDIANGIMREELRENVLIHGRSLLAGKYNVSPETIRRALLLLSDMEIVEVLPNKGVIVKSKSNAIRYVESFKNKKGIIDLKADLRGLLQQRDVLNDQIFDAINQLVDLNDRFRNSNPIFTVDIEIPTASRLCGKTISEVKFWQNTGGTIVAIKRQEGMVVSPGPYALLNARDVITVAGDSHVADRVKAYL